MIVPLHLVFVVTMKYDTTCSIFLLKNMIPNWRREGERGDWIMLMRGKRRDNIYIFNFFTSLFFFGLDFDIFYLLKCIPLKKKKVM